jgi:hypothetical protein
VWSQGDWLKEADGIKGDVEKSKKANVMWLRMKRS